MRNKPLNQKGFTLVELVIAISIATLVVAAAVAIWFQLTSVSARNSDYMAAYGHVQNAGYWFSRDAVQITQEPAFGGGNLVTLEWDEYGENPPHHVVVYTVDGASGELRRALDGGSPILIAEYISSASCGWNDPVAKDTLVLEVTAEVRGNSVTRTYKVEPRAFFGS